MLDAAAAAGVVPPGTDPSVSAHQNSPHGHPLHQGGQQFMFGPGGEDRPHELAVGVGQLPEDPRVVSFQKLGELQANRRERHRLRYLEQREVVLAASVQQCGAVGGRALQRGPVQLQHAVLRWSWVI